jgi:Fic family protein
VGQINAHFLDKPSPQLRKKNRIKTIHASLSIEGNTLTEDQISTVMESKRVVGPTKDVREVLNAIEVYDRLDTFESTSVESLLQAHGALMEGLVPDNGKFRKQGVGIMAGNQMAHMAPPAENVPHLMNDLLGYLKSSEEIGLIKSCVFHYELEFIHPFTDGNGRMGRLWQTLILMKEQPLFEFIPFENVIHRTQPEYYRALAQCDKAGNSTAFIEYMLHAILETLRDMLRFKGKTMSSEERLAYFTQSWKLQSTFNRQAYMSVFPSISTATASRDLKKGVESGLFSKTGDKTNTKYRIL